MKLICTYKNTPWDIQSVSLVCPSQKYLNVWNESQTERVGQNAKQQIMHASRSKHTKTHYAHSLFLAFKKAYFYEPGIYLYHNWHADTQICEKLQPLHYTFGWIAPAVTFRIMG